jgi:hypothetical protein
LIVTQGKVLESACLVSRRLYLRHPSITGPVRPVFLYSCRTILNHKFLVQKIPMGDLQTSRISLLGIEQLVIILFIVTSLFEGPWPVQSRNHRHFPLIWREILDKSTS